MSGGEQQRVAIARAVVMEPKIILADEPTGNLDSKNSDHLFDLLTQLNQEKGVSVVLVTHDLSLSKKMHRILQMKDGVFVD
jgi:ABC-type lipoprotein export system ATPase subunit